MRRAVIGMTREWIRFETGCSNGKKWIWWMPNIKRVGLVVGGCLKYRMDGSLVQGELILDGNGGDVGLLAGCLNGFSVSLGDRSL
jgi:hypothetical protein